MQGRSYKKRTKKNTQKKIYGYIKNIKKQISSYSLFFAPFCFVFFIIKICIDFIIYFHIQLFMLMLFLLLPMLYFNPPFTSLMLYRKFVDNQNWQKKIFIPIKSIPKRTQIHVAGIEDEHFYEHYGIDLKAIKTAYTTNKRLGYKFSGGSTITQQLTRNLFLVPTKMYIRKYLEVVISLELDLILSKHRILELYLNNIEFGNGIYGIGRAAIYYYGKPFSKLTNDQINRLIAIIPSPRLYNPKNFYSNKKLLARYNTLTRWSQ